MPLDPLLKAMREQQLALPASSSLGIDEARMAAAAWTRDLRDRGLRLYSIKRWEDRYILREGESILVRIYWPAAPGPLPIVVFCHGGGWVLGDLESYDNTCRALSSAAEAIVVAVDYRRAPEHPFPAAVDDCLLAVKWAAEHASALGGDPSRLFVAGDSAGGNLAAVVAQDLSAMRGTPLAGQVLIYPAVDHPAAGYPSYSHVAGDYCVDRDVGGIRWFVDLYLGGAGRPEDPRFAPMRAEKVEDLPAALIITAEYDPLRDEAEAYARRLADAGVPVVVKRFDGVNHGFFELPGMLRAADEALELVAEWFLLMTTAAV